ncbi:hypothetical protein [Novosphingobium gossypii]|uniref:hypothetical protein n=1 Tax=Novosphingobium gossypii TaxID=1604774 RepID=UPI003D1F0877
MFHQLDLFEPRRRDVRRLDMPAVVEKIMTVSPRPRYTLIVLNLLAKAADTKGVAGPYILDDGGSVPVRDWLGKAMIPMAQRHHRRQAIRNKLMADLKARGTLPEDPRAVDDLLETLMKDRLRQSARCSVSRAVSDLVRAGLLQRHYQGYCVDHVNRGAQREAVYTLLPEVRAALS